MRIPWIVTGAMATVGAFWLVLGALSHAELGVSSVALSALAGGLASGALIASHAPTKPTREPLLAALLGMGFVLAAMYTVVYSQPWRRFDPLAVWMLLAAPAIGGASGVTGAAIVRRLKGVSVSTLSVILLSSAVTFGVLIVLSVAAQLASADSAFVPIGLAGIAIPAFLTQLVIPVRAVWASAAGVVVFPVFSYLRQESASDLVISIVSSFVLLLVGRFGSQIATRITNPPHAGDLPSARAR
jgi:hypothetical protein